MKLKSLFNEMVRIGIENDPRPKSLIKSLLDDRKKRFKGLSGTCKEYFDKESLDNPYADSRIITGSPSAEIKKILVGVDIDTSELLLSQALNKKGEKIDLILSHHPIGRALVTFYDVMDLQVDVLIRQGVALGTAENLLFERKAEVERRITGANFAKTKDAAELLGINLACAHTVADNCAYTFLDKLFKKKKAGTLKEVVSALLEIPEYKYSASQGCPPRIASGKPGSRVKNLHFEFTGGTEGPKDIYEKLAAAGIDTIRIASVSRIAERRRIATG